MKCKNIIRRVLFLFLTSTLFPLTAWAAGEWPHPSKYLPSTEEIMKQKATCDDKTDLMATFHPKDILPPETWAKIHWDVGTMQALWAELVGFRSEALVGKIAPEIKPGKYTYKDVDQNPGLKKLFPDYVAKTIKQGAPPLICNIMDFWNSLQVTS